MLLLIFVSIWIYRKNVALAQSKGYTTKKWGVIGVVIYLGVAYGLLFIVGMFAGAGLIDIDLENSGQMIVGELLGYVFGGIATYFYYLRNKKKPTLAPDISSFGKKEDEEVDD